MERQSSSSRTPCGGLDMLTHFENCGQIREDVAIVPFSGHSRMIPMKTFGQPPNSLIRLSASPTECP